MNKPHWLDQSRIIIKLDARPLLAQGLHPLEQVQQQCSAMNPGEIFEITTPFPPSPIIEKMTAEGFEAHSETAADGMFHTYFQKNNENAK